MESRYGNPRSRGIHNQQSAQPESAQHAHHVGIHGAKRCFSIKIVVPRRSTPTVLSANHLPTPNPPSSAAAIQALQQESARLPTGALTAALLTAIKKANSAICRHAEISLLLGDLRGRGAGGASDWDARIQVCRARRKYSTVSSTCATFYRFLF